MIRLSIGSLAVAVAAGAAVTVTCLVLGVETTFAIGWGLALSAIIAVGRGAKSDDLAPWPPEVPVDDRVALSDVSRLAWTISPASGTPGRSAVLRVTEMMRRRLRSYGLELDDPGDATAIDRLIGAGVRTNLRADRPTVAALEAAIAAVERLPPSIQENS